VHSSELFMMGHIMVLTRRADHAQLVILLQRNTKEGKKKENNQQEKNAATENRSCQIYSCNIKIPSVTFFS